jgi:FAD-dependent monooxygenase
MYLVHFRSKALAKFRPFGPFWHILFVNGGGMIDQDGVDTFTIHFGIRDLNRDLSKVDPYEIIYETLGGTLGPFKIEIDEILAHSPWRMNYAVVDKYTSDGGRVILAGDAGK